MQVRSTYINSAEVQNTSEMERQNPDHIWGNDVAKSSSNVFLLSLCFLSPDFINYFVLLP